MQEPVIFQGKTKKYKVGLFECDCGTKVYKRLMRVVKGHAKHCGCEKIVHRKNWRTSEIKLRNIWKGMKSRVSCTTDYCYDKYGGRGIKMYEGWLDFDNFYNWAINHTTYRPNYSLDRINVNGDYEPDNCRFASNKEQANNKRTSTANFDITAWGETKKLWEWFGDYRTKVTPNTIHRRLKNGWTLEKALTTINKTNAKQQVTSYMHRFYYTFFNNLTF